MKTYFVTGGSGFIGSHFIDLILNKKSKIINLDKNKTPQLKYLNNKNYFFMKGNILDKKLIFKILKKFKPNYIINFAAETHVDKSIFDPNIFIDNNFKGTLNLLNCIKEFNLNLRFLQISTDEVFGELKLKEKPFNHNSPYNPRNPYSISKAAADNIVTFFNKAYDLDTVITICSNNFGSRQNPEKLIPLTILRMIKNSYVPLYGKGKNIRDWIFVEDHCRAIYNALKYGKSGQKYLLGTKNEISNFNLIIMISEIFDEYFPTNKPHKNLIKFIEDRKSHDFRYAINPKKSIKEIKFSYKNNFKNNLRKTINYYLENSDYYMKILDTDIWFKQKYNFN